MRSESPPQWNRRRKKIRRVHHAWSESTVELQQFCREREGIVRVELAERGAYQGYGTRPVSSRRNPRERPKSSMSSGLGTSYRRIKCAHQGGAESRGRVRRGPRGRRGGDGRRRGRGGVRGGDHGVRWRRERRNWRGGHGGVSVIHRDRGGVSGWGHRASRRWGLCYRLRAHKRENGIRRDRCGVSGGATGPAGGATGAGHRPMCARWRSTAAIAATVTASTIWCREGGGSAPEAFTMLELGARGGRRCVTRGLNISGGNGGVSLSLCSTAWNI